MEQSELDIVKKEAARLDYVTLTAESEMHNDQYHQPRSPAYLSTISNSEGGFSHQPQQQAIRGPHSGSSEAQKQAQASLFQSVANVITPPLSPSLPSVVDASRYSAPSRSVSSTLHEDTNSKREQRLLKNREAARECRRKKREYVRCLERQVAILQDQNRQLIEELQKMKTLCAGAFLDQPSQQSQLQTSPDFANNLGLDGGKMENALGGMDFVDLTASSISVSHHRRPSRSSFIQATPNTSGSHANDFHACTVLDTDNFASKALSSETTHLKSPVSQTQGQLLQLHALTAHEGSKTGLVDECGNSDARKAKQSDFSTGVWMSSPSGQKSNFLEDEVESQPSLLLPNIHPVKRVLKRFGNEQYRLSQQRKQHQQNID